jgi:hypothetical protein
VWRVRSRGVRGKGQVAQHAKHEGTAQTALPLPESHACLRKAAQRKLRAAYAILATWTGSKRFVGGGLALGPLSSQTHARTAPHPLTGEQLLQSRVTGSTAQLKELPCWAVRLTGQPPHSVSLPVPPKPLVHVAACT